MRYISYIGCCCLKKQQQQNQNNSEIGDKELRVVSITPSSTPWTAGQSGVITFNQNITLQKDDYGSVTLLSQNGEPYTIQFPGLMFGYKNNSMMIHQIYDDTSGGSHQMTGCNCYEVTISDNKIYVTYLDTNAGYYFNGISVQKIPKFQIYPELPWNDYGYIYDNRDYYSNLDNSDSLFDLLVDGSIKIFKEGQQLCAYQYDDTYCYLFDADFVDNDSEWWDEHSVGYVENNDYYLSFYLYKPIDRIEFPE